MENLDPNPDEGRSIVNHRFPVQMAPVDEENSVRSRVFASDRLRSVSHGLGIVVPMHNWEAPTVFVFSANLLHYSDCKAEPIDITGL